MLPQPVKFLRSIFFEEFVEMVYHFTRALRQRSPFLIRIRVAMLPISRLKACTFMPAEESWEYPT
jgi:hypothetical protein